MKKTQFIELTKLIRRTFAAFAAITLLVCIGIGVFIGFEWSYRAVQCSIDYELERDSFHDLEILSPAFLDDKTLDKIAAAELVSETEGYYYTFEFFCHDGDRLLAKVISITDRIDRLAQIVGTLPQAQDEIALEKHWAERRGIEVGDRICFDSGAAPSLLHVREFTVTALAESPAYISDESVSYGTSALTSTSVSAIMFVTPEAFNTSLLPGYPAALVRSDALRGLSLFSDEYKQKNDALRDSIADIADTAVVLTRAENAAVNIAENSISMFDNLKLSLGLLLIVISQFICFINIEKTIFDQSALIGMKKALGFSSAEITLQFVLYSFIASLIGCIAGLLVGRFLMESIFVGTAQATILFETHVYYFSTSEVLLIFALELLFSIASAVLACSKVLRQNAVSLLSGASLYVTRQRAFERSRLWNRLSLLSKTIVNNFLNDPRHVFATLLSFVGCTMLCVSSITVRELVSGSFQRHYEKIQSYDSVVYYDPTFPSAADELDALIQSEGFDHAGVFTSIGTLKSPDDKGISAYMFVPADGAFDSVLHLFSLDGEPGSLDDGIWISCAYPEYYALEPGDELRFVDDRGTEHALPIGAITEYYLQIPVIFMSAETYEAEFGAPPVSNAFLVNSGKTTCGTLKQAFLDVDGYITAYDFYAEGKLCFDAMNNVCTIVLAVFFTLSVLLAVFVILNLFLSFISEKKHEIITLLVNGYDLKAAKKYIYSDFVVLGVAGILIGNVCGQLFGRLTTLRLSGYTDYFLKEISWKASLTGSLLCAVLISAMCLISLRTIRNFDLTESNTIR